MPSPPSPLVSVTQDTSSNLPSPAKEWLSNPEFGEGDLRSYWKTEVPSLLSPEVDCDCLNITYDEESVERILFSPLDTFITGTTESKNFYESLNGLDGPPKLCGRLFKNGEPTYSCKDCGFDPTCVLCVDCFKNSSHRYHKYRMSMSGGGGYCDCGDSEAWKADPYCQIHLRGHQADKEKEKLAPESLLPPGVADRIRIVIRTGLRYCFELLTWETSIRCPTDLTIENETNPEWFATMLFNDEIHTYEQVITTLSRAIECNQKQAIDFATTIDREGRSIVKCSNFQVCMDIKRTIERITSRHNSKPLRVEVMFVPLIAHQTFAMRLLTWMQKVVSYCEAFRRIFSAVISESGMGGTEMTLLEQIMRADVCLWKTARNQWHQLFITGLLMESESKRQFAKVFTRIYNVLMKDFVTDDHEHSVSITSLSVQLYTVPSLGHSLIAEDDALLILLKAFLDECRRYLNHDGKLQFERNHSQIANFRRSQYILIDLRYLLSAKPSEWTEPMRKNFLHAFNNLVDLMDWMQGMDAVVRQVGQHVEFEAEWETGINLQLKLSHVISLIIEWAGSDRMVLMKALRYALKELHQKQGKMPVTSRTLLGVTVDNCIDYEVSSMPVSVHLPLSRLVAGLLLHLTRYDVNYKSSEFMVGCPCSSLIELMELPLRTLVMIAQYHAGMWRRNGYSLVNQVYFYHNVRLREEMYDRDILMLQYVAALIPADEFLVHAINKFGLFLVWSKDDYDTVTRKPEEDYLRQTITLIEDFLYLLLVIVSERHTPGVGKVTNDDRIKKEIIQWLCVEPSTHSDLLKMLPKDSCNEVVVENLINEVAEFKRPGPGQAGGKYEVRSECLKDFNPFFYHYTKQDQSTAEEVQLKRKRFAGDAFICCPPPPPPELSSQFHDLKHLLDCEVIIHIIHAVLKRTLNPYSTSWSETQFEKTLHLMGVALHEEDRTISQILQDPSITSHQTNFEFYFTHNCAKKGIPQLLEECLKSEKVEGHRDLLRWVIDKFNQVTGRRGYSRTTVSGKDVNPEPSTSSSSSSSGISSIASLEKKKNADAAAIRRARIMAQMIKQQSNFMKEHAQYFNEMKEETSVSSMDTRCVDDREPVAAGLNQRGRVIEKETHTCILCREEQDVTASGRCLVLAAFVQRSTVLSKNRERKVNFTDEAVEAVFMPADLYFGPHVSTCGHVMHSDCWQRYFEAVLAKERRRPVRYVRHVSFDVDKNEFLCPLCECLSNTVIPLLPPTPLPQPSTGDKEVSPSSYIPSTDLSMCDWLTALHSTVEGSAPIWIKDPSMNIETGEKYICRLKPPPMEKVLESLESKISESGKKSFSDWCQAYEKSIEENHKLSQPILEMMRLLSQAVYTIGLNVHQNSEDDRVPVLSYWSCAFTIHSIERVLRDESKAIFSDLSSRKFNCLQALVRYVANSSGVFSVAVIRTHALKLLKYLLINEAHVMSSTSFLDIDAFGLLVSLVLSTPSIFVRQDDDDPGCLLTLPTGNVFDRNFVNLVLTLNLVQVILTKEAPVERRSSPKEEEIMDEPMDTDAG